MGDEGGGIVWTKLITLIFVILSFIVLFILLTLALLMPSLRS